MIIFMFESHRFFFFFKSHHTLDWGSTKRKPVRLMALSRGAMMVAVNVKIGGFKTDLGDRVYQT